MKILFFGERGDTSRKLQEMLKDQNHEVVLANTMKECQKLLLGVSAIVFFADGRSAAEEILTEIDVAEHRPEHPPRLAFVAFTYEQIESLRAQQLLTGDMEHCWFDPRNVDEPNVLQWVLDFLTSSGL